MLDWRHEGRARRYVHANLRWIKARVVELSQSVKTMIARALTAMPVAAFVACAPAHALDAVVTYKSLSPEIALDLARAALADCRQHGYQVAVAVVDRFGVTQVVLRDRFAGPHTAPTATGKAWTAISFRTNTTDLIDSTRPGTPQAGVRDLPGVVILGGGVVVEAGGSLLGAIGVSGAPGGDADEACAKAGIAAIQDKIDF